MNGEVPNTLRPSNSKYSLAIKFQILFGHQVQHNDRTSKVFNKLLDDVPNEWFNQR